MGMTENGMCLAEGFCGRRVAAAVRTADDFEAALASMVRAIFMQNSSILTAAEQIKQAHAAGKRIFIHMDFVEGIGKDRAGLAYLKALGADGILSTKSHMIRLARETELATVQRFFIVDSHSVDTAVETVRIAKPDIAELMPGVVVKKIREFAEQVNLPILVGGLLEYEAEVDAAIEAGASAISTARRSLWNYR